MPAKIKLSSTAEKDTKYARLTARQWAEAEGLWERGEVTLSQLAERYGKDVSAFTKHFKKKSLSKGSKSHEVKEKVEAAIEKSIASEAEITVQRIKETKDDQYKMAKTLGALAFSEVVQARQSGRPVASATANLKAIELALNAVGKSLQQRWTILGLDSGEHVDESQLPELFIAQLSDEEISDIQKAQGEDPTMVSLDDEIDVLDEDEGSEEEAVVESGFEEEEN